MYSLKEEKISQITPFSVLADNKRIRNKILDGKSTQATRSGKNLFDKYGDFSYGSTNHKTTLQDDGTLLTTANYSNNRSSGILIENLKENTIYTISGILISADGTSTNNALVEVLTTGTVDLSRYFIKKSETKPFNFKFKINTGDNSSIWVSLNGVGPTTQTSINTVFDKIQLEEGNTATDYEPYGASPSPEFPSPIKSVGDDVNLFDEDNATITSLNCDGGTTFYNARTTKSIIFDCSKYEQLAISKKIGNYFAIIASSKYPVAGVAGVIGTRLAIDDTKSKDFFSINCKDYNYLTIVFWINTDTITESQMLDTIKIQKGTVATPYSEYGKGTVTIEQRGKNLFDASKIGNTDIVVSDNGQTITMPIVTSGSGYTTTNKKLSELCPKLKVGDIVYLLFNRNLGYIYNNYIYLSGKNEIWLLNRSKTITQEMLDSIVIMYGNSFNSGETEQVIITNFRIVKNTDDEWEQYFSKDYVLPTQPLRSLPNGTKDTIEEDGIHRRVGSVVFDGSDDEDWELWTFESEENIGFWIDNFIDYNNSKGSDIRGMCNLFNVIVNGDSNYENIGLRQLGDDFKRIYVCIKKERLETQDIVGFKKWLNDNSLKLIYELSEEVVEPFTDEQQAVLNSMETLEGTNHFSLIGDLQTTLTFDYNPKITEEIKRAFKYNITKAYLEVAATDKASGFQINEDNYLQSIDFDDCRYIEGEGIIGSCVAKELQGKFVNVDTSFDIENRELECFIGAETEDNITHYLRLGTFIVQKPENDNVKDNTSFDSLDYMIKFNKEYVHRMAKYLKTKDIDIIKDKQYYILTESGAYEEVIVPHKEEISNYYELIDEYTLMQLLKDICEQCEVKLGTFDFRNANYVVHGNRFDTGTTCRDVLKAIAQAAFSWARINEYNELLLDFETSDTITEEIDYNEYYNLSFNDKYGPVNTIVLKNSQVEGENITVQDETLVKNYGIKELAISDNPFAYSEETRKAIIEAGKMLYGFTYVPLTVETIGAAYLNCKDKIKVKNMQDGDLETYLFDTRISYQGTLKSNVETLAMTDTETKYRYDGSLTTAQRRTEYRVDKAEQKMTSLVKLTTEQGEKLTEAVQDLDGFKRTIINKTDETNEKITTIEETVNGLVTEKSVSGGQNLIKNSVGYFGNDYWQINETTEGKVLNDNSTDVKQNSISGSALKLQSETIYQDIKEIKNGEYYLSFNYKRIINTAIATLKVNDLIINLTEENWKEEAHLINVTTNNIRIEITTDLNSSILITDLMLTEGNIKVSWTQNANESYTDTVQIGKGVRITATGSDTEFVAEATGITINNTETGGKVAEFTKYGTETQELVAHKDVKVADSLLIQKIGNQTWFSSL